MSTFDADHIFDATCKATVGRQGVARQSPMLPPYPRDLSVPDIFRWYAEHTPDAPAVLSRNSTMTYRELDRRTNQLARRLIVRGVGHGSIVGILTNRSVETIVAWLATLKCGAAYLPLDPAYPESFLAYMVDDCKPALILGERQLIAARPEVGGASISPLEDELAAAGLESAEPCYASVSPTDTAYLMYTSGSTGRPKGVIIPHRGIVRLVRDQTYARFAEDEVFLSLAALSFDASTFEIWGALLNGARVGIVGGTAPSLDEIASAIRTYGVTTLWLTAGLFHVFVDRNLEGLRPLRQLLTGGDVLSADHVERTIAALPECRLINGYGPTENTTFSCCFPISRSNWNGSGSVPIGRSIAHTEVHILDDDLKPVTDGAVGQLCVGGDGLALGYVNNPELSAEKFVVSPLAAAFDGRIYLTGDLGRLRPDGNIEFLGRTDRQVKIDGKRIELDEIELNLRGDARLADAIVVLRTLGPDHKKIAAFLKPASIPADPRLKEAITTELRRKIPAHMIPNEVVVVDTFPLTPNGKVDRKALLALCTQHVNLPPPAKLEGELEENLALIWSRVLKSPQIDRNANFFDLGGTSLQMVQIHAEITDSLAFTIAITDLFAHPRIADLARFLNGNGGTSDPFAEAKSRAARQSTMVRRAHRTMRKTIQ